MSPDQRLAVLEAYHAEPCAPAAELAVRLGFATDEVAAELAALRAEGVIRAERAVIDWDKIDGGPIYAFVDVQVSPEPDFGFDAIAQRLALFDEVHSLYLISGGRDLLVVVEGRDYRQIALFVAEKLAPMKGVRSTATSFVLRKYKMEGQLLLSALDDQRLPVAP